MAGDNTSVSDLAGRYAAALLDLADERKALDEVAEDLKTVRALIAESEDLRRLLASPVFTREEQRRARRDEGLAAGTIGHDGRVVAVRGHEQIAEGIDQIQRHRVQGVEVGVEVRPEREGVVAVGVAETEAVADLVSQEPLEARDLLCLGE